MCGIAGIIYKTKSVELNEIEAICNCMIYRGPDDYGYYLSDTIGLGHRRLSIIDPELGKQPMQDDRAEIVVVFNGEIYNFKELREELKTKGYNFKTNSDTEALIYSYKEYGISCLKKFNGDFSFALYDKNNKKIFLVRDRIGVKPVYYQATSDRFIFCSELKPLLKTNAVDFKLNRIALDFYLAFGYLPSSLTFAEGVEKLEPGTFIEIDLNLNVRKVKYWSIDSIVEEEQTKEKIIERLNYLIGKSVSYRLISDVPLGIFLSGGIDSNVLLSYIKYYTNEKIKAFTITFPESPYFNEGKLSSLSPQRYRCVQKFIPVLKEDFSKNIQKILNLLDEPIADTSIYITYLISKFSKDEITVALTGAGGDEIFAGYRRYQGYKISQLLKPFARFIPHLITGKRYLKRSNFLEDLTRSVQIILSGAKEDFAQQFISYFFTFDHSLRKDILRDPFKEPAPELFIKSEFGKLKGSELKKMMKFDIKYYLPDNILFLTDKMSMRNSQEVRVPLLDHNLVEWALTIPDKFLVSVFSTKKIFREFAKNILPKELLKSKRKRGFSVPISNWLREYFKESFTNLFEERKVKRQKIFNYDFIIKMSDDHFSNKKDYSGQLFSLYTFQVWLDDIANNKSAT